MLWICCRKCFILTPRRGSPPVRLCLTHTLLILDLNHCHHQHSPDHHDHHCPPPDHLTCPTSPTSPAPTRA